MLFVQRLGYLHVQKNKGDGGLLRKQAATKIQDCSYNSTPAALPLPPPLHLYAAYWPKWLLAAGKRRSKNSHSQFCPDK